MDDVKPEEPESSLPDLETFKNPKDIMLLIKVQCMIKRFVRRLKVRAQQKLAKESDENLEVCFSLEEKQETHQLRPKNGVPYTYKCSGAIYQGEWFGGFRHGQGVITWKNGDRYEGAWEYGVPIYRGSYHFASKQQLNNSSDSESSVEVFDCYVGAWSNETMHGVGTFKKHNGEIYSGKWVYGLKEGMGMLRTKEFVYKGQF